MSWIPTWENSGRFIDDENRYIIFILKKNGVPYTDQDMMETTRYRTILKLGQWINAPREFNDERHFVNYLSKMIVRNAWAHLSYTTAAKRSGHVISADQWKSSPDREGDNDLYSMVGKADEQLWHEENDVNVFLSHIEQHLSTMHSFIIRQRIKGIQRSEIAKSLEMSPTTVSSKLNQVKELYVNFRKKLPAPGESQEPSDPIRDRVREQMEIEKQKKRDSLDEVRALLQSL